MRMKATSAKVIHALKCQKCTLCVWVCEGKQSNDEFAAVGRLVFRSFVRSFVCSLSSSSLPSLALFSVCCVSSFVVVVLLSFTLLVLELVSCLYAVVAVACVDGGGIGGTKHLHTRLRCCLVVTATPPAAVVAQSNKENKLKTSCRKNRTSLLYFELVVAGLLSANVTVCRHPRRERPCTRSLTTMSDVFQFAAQQTLSKQSNNNQSATQSDSDDDDARSFASASSAGQKSAAASEPSFASANFSTILPEYRNRGQDAVKMAFQPTSFSSIRDLPTKISFTSVEHALYDKAASNLHSAPLPPQTRKMGYKNLFSQFQYIPEEYELKKQLDAQEAKDLKEKRLKVGKGKEFAPTGVIEKKLPGQDQFLHENSMFYNDARLKNKYKWQSDPIERYQEMITRERLARYAANINPAFCPGGTDEKVDTTMPSRSLLPDILLSLKSTIAKDWKDVGVSTFEDRSCIVVEFSGVDPDDSHGVAAYMNIFHRKNPIAARYKLAKNATSWNKSHSESDGSLTIRFSMMPPWIRGQDLGVIWKHVRDKGNKSAAVE